MDVRKSMRLDGLVTRKDLQDYVGLVSWLNDLTEPFKELSGFKL